EQVTGVQVKRAGDTIEVSWNRARDNTLTAYYQVLAEDKVVAETHRLSATLAAKSASGPFRVLAYDLYGNVSLPSAAVRQEQRRRKKGAKWVAGAEYSKPRRTRKTQQGLPGLRVLSPGHPPHDFTTFSMRRCT